MKNRSKVFILIIIFLILTILLIFLKIFDYKILKFGNNKNISKSIQDIESYILNISSYEAKIYVEIASNKNNNRYILSQKYCEPNIFSQEVIEPSNIESLKTIYDGSRLKIENTKLNLSTIYENYEYICDNILFLNSFIEDYKNSDESEIQELNDMVILKTKVGKEKNRYTAYKILYIDKATLNPVKLEVQDINKKNIVYILYKEIKINTTKREEVLAINIHTKESDI